MKFECIYFDHWNQLYTGTRNYQQNCLETWSCVFAWSAFFNCDVVKMMCYRCPIHQSLSIIKFGYAVLRIQVYTRTSCCGTNNYDDNHLRSLYRIKNSLIISTMFMVKKIIPSYVYMHDLCIWPTVYTCMYTIIAILSSI